ncbi:unnamed protein product [Mucor fragilis]
MDLSCIFIDTFLIPALLLLISSFLFHLLLRRKMQLFDRLFRIKKHRQTTQNDSSIKSADSHSTSSSASSSTIGRRHGSIKRFSSLRHWRSTSKPASQGSGVLDRQQQQQQQSLLTQCIETALYANPTHTDSGAKRWSYGDAPATSNISFQEQQPSPPPAQPRQRKLSLPPQPTHIGYLASIPEVDSQITLNLNK